MTLAIVALPELLKEDLDWIQDIRKKYDEPFFSILGPHFTLVFPTDALGESELSAHAKRILDNESSFGVVMRRAALGDDPFEGLCRVFLVPDQGSRRVTELHYKLYTAQLEEELRTDIPYAPHVSIGNSKDEHICAQLMRELNAERFEIIAEVNRVDVVRIEGDSLKIVSSIELERK
jgi:hypothetical protein